MKAALLVVLLWALMPSSSSALDTSELNRLCNSNEGMDQGICLMYLRGVLDQLKVSKETRRRNDGGDVCIPDWVGVDVVKAMFLKEIRDHPGWLSIDSAIVMNLNFIETWGICSPGEECSC